jgi:hypothetical protein
VESHGSEGKCQLRAARVCKGNRDIQKTTALGKTLLILDRRKLANQIINILAGGCAQDIPNLHKRIRERVNDRTTNGQGDVAQKTVTNCILPVGRIRALDDLVVLQGNNARQLDTSLGMPRKITLLRELKLGRTTETRLRGRRIKLDRLQSKRAVAVVQKAPEGRLRLLRLVIRQELIGMALVANLSKNGIVRRATHFEFFWTRMSSRTKFNASPFLHWDQRSINGQLKQTHMESSADFAFDEVPPCYTEECLNGGISYQMEIDEGLEDDEIQGGLLEVGLLSAGAAND